MANKDKLYVIKIGGNIIDNDERLLAFLRLLSKVKGKIILVHGGGKLATKLAADLNIPQQMVDGRRITDADTLRIVTMVYAGYINKNIVAGLQQNGVNAIGLSGADANLILAHKRTSTSVDYGFVGDIDEVNHAFIEDLLNKDFTLVIAPITHNGQGQLLNTNADTIAQTLATSLAEKFNVELIYGFEKAGVLTDVENDASVIPVLNPALYQSYRQENKIFAGMIPKLDNAFSALDAGVQKVIIGKAEELDTLIAGSGGTSICHD